MSDVQGTPVPKTRTPMAPKLTLGPRLAALGAFNTAVFFAYLQIIERSRTRGGSFQRDGYDFWAMWRQPTRSEDVRQQPPWGRAP